MGEAVYYMKVRFADQKTAQENLKRVDTFLAEGREAEDFWQEHRHMDREPGGREKFWTEFKEKFPTIAEFLGTLVGVDCNNALAGKLNFGDGHLQVLGNEIRYHAQVWHFADWSEIASWIENQTGGKAAWISDEYMEPFNSF